MNETVKAPKKMERTSTVGRGRAVKRTEALEQSIWEDELVRVTCGDSVEQYRHWERPTCIVSDGGYGVLGFEGDTSDHLGLPEWYEPHIAEWSKYATAETTLWFWNSEIGWAAVHPILEKYGWRYVNANTWNKGKGHIAGNVNTAKIRRFPVTTEICVQYVFEARVSDTPLREWLIGEWARTGLPRKAANTACGVKDAAARKYLDKGHLWYFPPPEMFEKLQAYANEHGKPEGRPYFSIDGKRPATGEQWGRMRAKFRCPYGVTNVWERPALRGKERFSVPGGKAVHLNQKPLDLMTQIIAASTDSNDVVWEPFGGLFSATVASRRLGRRAFSSEIDPTYFYYGLERIKAEVLQRPLL
ncbi:DNA methyltransferase [Microbulbifer hydrolyticus]|uniref:Methyltransferase n=1 Tax=Microbulbifer hydrolyticus TaxID=48074 RepID=A0A6P1TBT7_9GAMM|nr:DNA methyltransferase [Microbulbifer hydrolyticus]MBB5212623.1 site-specific DNA-methyltransferase (adenine-specific) [Microbulbifer hydrolyticus]QHQ40228.1 site-specific DNA-methyltransferase [Microbulbifer hydrolyticus]